jgi:molybdopterin-containing oxidoreductase family iron-sulfur binding subunit
MNQFEQYRRRFIGGALAATGAALVPGVMLMEVAHSRAPEEGVSSKNRWGLLIDTTKCATGCNDCVTACNTENGLSGKTGLQDSQWIRKVELTNNKTGATHSLPMMCQHCEHPPCVDVCPTGASFKRADGIVLVDRHICIGCRYCMMACPYKARSLVHEDLNDTQLAHMPRGKGCVESCTLCMHKVDRGDRTTACAEACPEKAIVFGDLNDPNCEIAQRLATYASKEVRADLGLNTGVRYTGI